jgi:hypothetical protein|tara:strand:+ start:1223 stop:2020 length:798 start_codon:yes stop_codon:yes gene_type:complete
MAFTLRSILRGAYGKSRRNAARPKKGATHPNNFLTDGPLSQLDHQYRKPKLDKNNQPILSSAPKSFLQTVFNNQLARTERFECQFNFPHAVRTSFHNSRIAENATIMCEEVQIPGMAMANKEYNVGPWTHYRNTNLQFLGQEINFTFYTDTNWELRELFENWFAMTVDPTSKQSYWPNDTWGTISINAMDLQDNYRRSWVLHEVTPKVLNLQPMSMGSVGVVRTTLIVSATYWDSNYIEVDMGAPEGKVKGVNKNETKGAGEGTG